MTTGTGSGKSLAYIVPIVDRIIRKGSGGGIKAIIAKATGESLSLLPSEPPNLFAANLAPQPSVLSSMQEVYLAAGNLDYHTPLPMSQVVDPSFADHAG